MKAYDKIASMGRYGDSDMRYIDGSPAHVNSWEAWLVDTYGDRGEEIVEEIGSGTTNPLTGLPEYHFKWGLHHHGIKKRVQKLKKTYREGGGSGVMQHIFAGDNKEINILGMKFDTSGGRVPAEAAKKTQLGIFNDGLDAVLKDLKSYTEDGGVIDQEYNIAAGTASENSRTSSLEALNQSQKEYIQTGLTYSGTVQQNIENTQDDIQKEFESTLEGAGIVKEKAIADQKSIANQRVQGLITNYQDVIAETNWEWFMDDYVQAPLWPEYKQESDHGSFEYGWTDEQRAAKSTEWEEAKRNNPEMNWGDNPWEE